MTEYRAESGEVFDASDPIHKQTDVMRMAQWIQMARDAGDYQRSDSLRAQVTSWGMEVRQNKQAVTVTERPLNGRL